MRRWFYNLTPDKFDSMVIAQLGRCANALCDEPLDHVDHDHSCCSGERSCGECVRGLLCRRCNLTLGNANDDAERLLGLVGYLRGGQ